MLAGCDCGACVMLDGCSGGIRWLGGGGTCLGEIGVFLSVGIFLEVHETKKWVAGNNSQDLI